MELQLRVMCVFLKIALKYRRYRINRIDLIGVMSQYKDGLHMRYVLLP
jgi:hypothetical protein